MKGGTLRTQDLNLSENQTEYLSDLVSSLQEQIGDKLLSIILFGSAVKGGFIKGISDFDMIIVVDDSIPSKQIRTLTSEVQSLSEKHGVVSSTTEEFEGIPQFIMTQTGMFMSQFICRRRDFVSGRFSKIFGANALLAKLFSPSSTVLGGALKGSRTVYGEDLVSRMEIPSPRKLDVLKSLIMNEILVELSLFYYPFAKNATKMAMEASKWNVHMASYLLTGESKSLPESIETVTERGIVSDHLIRLEKLRGKYEPDLSFIVSTLKAIGRIHLFLLEEKDIFSK